MGKVPIGLHTGRWHGQLCHRSRGDSSSGDKVSGLWDYWPGLSLGHMDDAWADIQAHGWVGVEG